MKFLLNFFILFYQWFISPILGPRCRFYPSCSEYAKTCLTRYSLVKSGQLIAKRICRCHPWSEGGHDPVP